jgi:predicted dehydrogenase
MLRIGVIGAGMVSQLCHIANFTEIEGCRVTAIAELRAGLGEAAAHKFGIPTVHPTHRELLADDDVDAVVVVTRRHATGPVVYDALRAGKHVLSEKPMAHTVEQAERLVGAAREYDRIYAVGFMKRHDAGVARAKALLDDFRRSGELGAVVFARAYCFAGGVTSGGGGYVMTGEERPDGIELWPVAPAWLPPELHADYAEFLNVYSHTINLSRFLLGARPRVRSANLSNPKGRLIDLDFGDFSAALEFGDLSPCDWREGIEVFFERGSLRVGLPQPFLRGVPATVELYRNGRDPHTVTFSATPSWAFRRQAEAFVRSAAEGRTPLAGGADSIVDHELTEAIYELHLRARHDVYAMPKG